jgi:hypothetical protein
LINGFRKLADLIKFNAGISDPDKIAIGVRPVNTSREPIRCASWAGDSDGDGADRADGGR